MLSLCVGTLGWWSFGWGFATGTLFQDFIGTSGFFGSDLLKVGSGQSLKATISCDDGVCPTKMAVWFFNWGFCTTACTIVSGAVLERAKELIVLGLHLFHDCLCLPSNCSMDLE